MDVNIKMGKIMKAYEEYADKCNTYQAICRADNGKYTERQGNACAKMHEAQRKFEDIASKLSEAIKEAECNAKRRTISAREVCEAITKIEDRLLHITKKAMTDTTFGYDCNAQSFPHAYRYTPYSTLFRARFDGKEWRILYIGRDVCNKKTAYISLSDTAREAVLNKIIDF